VDHLRRRGDVHDGPARKFARCDCSELGLCTGGEPPHWSHIRRHTRSGGIAVLKYRLYDIDLIINRTLVYGTLTAALVGVYFVGIVSLQRLFVLLTGQQSTPVVASTLLIAALFNP